MMKIFENFNFGHLCGCISGLWIFNKFIGMTDFFWIGLIIITFVLEVIRLNKTHHAEIIDEAIDDLQTFLEVDIWHAKQNEWKTEKDMLKYLRGHFNIFRKEIKRVLSKEKAK
jgi:hypothetical protein